MDVLGDVLGGLEGSEGVLLWGSITLYSINELELSPKFETSIDYSSRLSKKVLFPLSTFL